MSDHECLECGNIFDEPDEIVTFPPEPNHHQCEYADACPECGSTDLDEAIGSATALRDRMAAMWPGRWVVVTHEVGVLMSARHEHCEHVTVQMQGGPESPATYWARCCPTLRAALAEIRAKVGRARQQQRRQRVAVSA